MIAWIMVILILLLILTFPIGIDAAYAPERYWLKLKLGPFRVTVMPGRGKKKRKKKAPSQPKPEETATPHQKKRRLPKLGIDDVRTLAEIVLRAIRRFRAHLSVDRLYLDWTSAAADPYAAVVQYGRVNALLGALSGPVHRTFRIRSEDVRVGLDLEATKPIIDVQLVMSLQVWEILLIAVCAGASGIRWYCKKKRKERAAVNSSAGKEPA